MGYIRLIHHVAIGHAHRFIRFGIVGASGAVVNTLLLYVLVQVGRCNPLVAATVATEMTILSNFALNDHWTFSNAHTTTPWVQRAVRYNAIALGGLAIAIAVLTLLTRGLGIYYLGANLVGIVAATLWNYVGNSHLTWVASKHKERAGSAEPLLIHEQSTDNLPTVA